MGKLIMLCGSECWRNDEKIDQSTRVAEMRKLRWMSKMTREEGIKNKYSVFKVLGLVIF